MTTCHDTGDGVRLRWIYTACPETCQPLGVLIEAVMRDPSPFSQGERETIAAYVSGLNACRYCHGVHSQVARACGVAPRVQQELLEDVERATVEERMKPVLRYAQKLTEVPSRVTEADAEAVYAAGWDNDALHFAVAVTTLFNSYSRFAEGLGLATPEGCYAEAGQRFATAG